MGKRFTLVELARKIGISRQRVHVLAQQNRLHNLIREGNRYFVTSIPENPRDAIIPRVRNVPHSRYRAIYIPGYQPNRQIRSLVGASIEKSVFGINMPSDLAQELFGSPEAEVKQVEWRNKTWTFFLF